MKRTAVHDVLNFKENRHECTVYESNYPKDVAVFK